ncbi:uncharacterized protein F4812DRAFT_429916 [Daldinia caldariorum]|uniref:uncharacterized protein n=1 Tax=Daldinia caldariorum TaxID=326644 RepID=UPI0020086D1E|nr:uncharacterized protein F4812DRAFT_429916 [Daldinia caldariorum]KAI1467536.1 hypothetical protein F4812DRAFT_429916 [Daldinia caldariorum]
MKVQVASAAGLLLAGQALAAPRLVHEVRDVKTAASIIAEVAPSTRDCAAGGECVTADVIGPLLVSHMQQYGIYNPAQMAGIIALTAFESVEYTFKHNVSPGRPGQGTSNMQMFNFNLKYAQSIPELKDKVAGITEDAPDDKKNEVLSLVNDNKYNFGSGPWYFSTQCGADVKEALKAGDDAGFAAYMRCVGVTIDSGRQGYWDAARKAFGLM